MSNIIKGSKGCFPGSAIVTTPYGLQKIKAIDPGDKVMAFDRNGKLSEGIVKEVHRHKVRETGDKYIELHHEHGVLTCTNNHWIFCPDGKFIEAGLLKVDNFLVLENGRYSKITKIRELVDDEDEYTLTVVPQHTFVVDGVRVHNKGGGKGGGSTRTPVEDENTLRARQYARVVDVLCEGEIEGLIDGARTIYFNEVQLQNSETGLFNFDGVSWALRKGTSSQSYLPGFPTSESETVVNTRVTKEAGAITFSINDIDVDHVRITMDIPALFQVNASNGDVTKRSVSYKIEIQPDAGGWVEAKTVELFGKCTSKYRKATVLRDLATTYGAGPWDIRVIRLSGDDDSTKSQSQTWWYSYTEIIDEKIRYLNTAVIGYQVNAEQFGTEIPRRAVGIKGLKIKIPSNYDPVNRTYTGNWGGSFVTAYSNNPSWVFYDLLTNTRYGLGLPEEYVDKWTLYTIGQYCDGNVDDGEGGTEPRFTFNGIIANRQEANHVINILASSFRAMPIWATGLATAAQDSPRDPVKLVTEANVVDGVFNYEGSGLKQRHTSINVSWNDPDDFYRLAVETVDDPDGIDRYGYRPLDVVAYGCTSRGQAYRYGKWILETEINQTETVTYQCSFDHIDILPGDVIKVLDPNYAAIRHGGRLADVDSTGGTWVDLDQGITLATGKTYQIDIYKPDGDVLSKNVTTTPDDAVHTRLDFSALDATAIPQIESVFVVTASDVSPRQFRVVSVTEDEKQLFTVRAVIHDPNKFARVEQGITFDDPPFTTLPSADTPLQAPTNLSATEYTYADGESQNFGVLLSWRHPLDQRIREYEVQYRRSSGGYTFFGQTAENSIEIQPLEGDTYDFRVKSVGFAGDSAWATLDNYVVTATINRVPDITGLQVKGGGTSWGGRDCEIEWDALNIVFGDTTSVIDTTTALVIDATADAGDYYIDDDRRAPKLQDYRVEVLKTDNTHLRYAFTLEPEYTYPFEKNVQDNGGNPIRSIKFKVVARDIYGNLSANPATITATNPEPNMSGSSPNITSIFNGLKIDWSAIVPSDTDLLKYKVYLDGSNPPTTEVAEVSHPTTYWIEMNVTANETYYIQIEPYDEFGAGTKSSVPSGIPTPLNFEDIEGELTNRLSITDSLGTDSTAIAVLYDGNKTVGGIAYTSGDWIQYKFPIEQLLDRVTIWFSGNANVYFSTSVNGTDWEYFGGEADHTLTSEDRLVSYGTDSTSALNNYWTANAGANNLNWALFPNRLTMVYARMHILSSTTVRELIFVDQVIAEQIIANALSAITANLGTITTGTIQNTAYPNGGMLIDADNALITIKDAGATTRVLLGKIVT